VFFRFSLAASGTAVFGETKPGDIFNWDSSSHKDVSRFQVLDGDGDVSKLTFWCKTSSSAIKGVIYYDNSEDAPGALLGSTVQVTVTNTNYHWEDLPFTSSIHVTNGSYYWLGICVLTGATVYWQDVSGNDIRYNSGGPSDPFGTVTYGELYRGEHISIYATYTQTAGPTSSSIGTSSTRAGVPCDFYGRWSDPDGLDSCIFSTNNTGIWVNTTVPVSGTESWANVTETLISSVGTTVRFRWYCNDTNGDMGDTGTKTLVTTDGDAIIADMMSRISESEIYSTVVDLQNFGTRKYGFPGNVEAAAYLYNSLGEIPGLSVEYQGSYNNVIATLLGTDANSNAVYMVGAHYDDTSSDPNNAPGATDNGGGVAIVLELARIMSEYRFNYTLKFAFWNAEESGLLGSAEYAKYAHDNNVNITLYVNFDGACYDPYDELVFNIVYNSRSSSVHNLMVQHNTLYGISCILRDNASTPGESDIGSFWQYGYTAAWVCSETNDPAHTPADTIDQVSTLYAKKNGQLGMSVLAILAEVLGFNMSLKAGWNMVSFPMIPRDARFSSVFSSAGFYEVFTWSGTSYVDGKNGNATAGQSYWVLVLADTTIDITGALVESYEVDLPAGWTMIGSIYGDTVDAATVFPSTYELLTWSGTSYATATKIEPGRGYWALVLVNTEITVPP
jgi:hypothetical protein